MGCITGHPTALHSDHHSQCLHRRDKRRDLDGWGPTLHRVRRDTRMDSHFDEFDRFQSRLHVIGGSKDGNAIHDRLRAAKILLRLWVRRSVRWERMGRMEHCRSASLRFQVSLRHWQGQTLNLGAIPRRKQQSVGRRSGLFCIRLLRPDTPRWDCRRYIRFPPARSAPVRRHTHGPRHLTRSVQPNRRRHGSGDQSSLQNGQNVLSPPTFLTSHRDDD